MLFSTIYASSSSLTLINVILSTLTAVGCGIAISTVAYFTKIKSRNFLFSLSILPAIVQFVIVMVNGNLGVGLAVAGAFSLIRFRSAQGTAKDICFIFFAMCIGLVVGMGYLTLAIFISVVLSVIALVLSRIPVFKENGGEKLLKIVVPESLNYENAFDDIFNKYATKITLEKVKTINLGSLYELKYLVRLKSNVSSREMLDELRCRNGNLTVAFGIDDKSEIVGL